MANEVKDYASIVEQEKDSMRQVVEGVERHSSMLFSEANILREKILEVRTQIIENASRIYDFNEYVANTIKRLQEVEDSTSNVYDRISEVIDEGDVPEVNYEDFVGFCESCGKSLTKEDDYVIDPVDGIGVVCAQCIADGYGEDVTDEESEASIKPIEQ